MNILIMSDSHGSREALCRAISLHPYDLLIHCGDGCNDIDSRDIGNRQSAIVYGNTDYTYGFGSEVVVETPAGKLLVTHGWQYDVKNTFDRLAAAAKGRGCKYAIFGHTHKQYIGEHGGITLINPGSIRLKYLLNPIPHYATAVADSDGLKVEFHKFTDMEDK